MQLVLSVMCLVNKFSDWF